MPLVLQLYRDTQRRLKAEGHAVRMVAARGPHAVAGWLLGITEFMVALKRQPESAAQVLDVLTETIITWLRAQADAVGGRGRRSLLLDDIPGLLSPKLFDSLAAPYLARIFEAFDGLVRVYHNDTPCPHLLPRLAEPAVRGVQFQPRDGYRRCPGRHAGSRADGQCGAAIDHDAGYALTRCRRRRAHASRRRADAG